MTYIQSDAQKGGEGASCALVDRMHRSKNGAWPKKAGTFSKKIEREGNMMSHKNHPSDNHIPLPPVQVIPQTAMPSTPDQQKEDHVACPLPQQIVPQTNVSSTPEKKVLLFLAVFVILLTSVSTVMFVTRGDIPCLWLNLPLLVVILHYYPIHFPRRKWKK